MDFKDTPEEAAFRAEVRAWLAEHAVRYDDRTTGELPLEKRLALGREWQALKAERGFAKITWPREFCGIGGTAMQQVIYQQEEANYRLPNVYFKVSLGMPLPILRRFGSPEQQQRYLGPGLRGDEIWCQLFSEPAAGSDLAGVRLRAVRDGDDWILNGQKIWTSWAQVSDFGVIVTRSDPSVPKHKGMTYFFVDMKSPGIEVRPIKQISGGEEFNEVYFTDVRVPDSQRLGDVHGGWKVALATLMEERFSVVDVTGGGPDLDHLIRFCEELALEDGLAIDDSDVRQRIAEWYTMEQGLKANYYRALTTLSNGGLPGPEGAINKICIPYKLQQMSKFAMDLMGAGGVLAPSEGQRASDYFVGWLEAAGYRIAGGTDEILRNTIAEQVLKMPADVRVDKDVPFNQL
ncbi:MAG: acyl-CoA dehydrogenase family protein [Rhodocyclaceae bacterium]|jgi:acyl-CoA dehydrogenase|nr:acyl-CoA dehydrogenase family protein [Rhodocyclaceae bacterium]